MKQKAENARVEMEAAEYGMSWVEVLRDVRKESSSANLPCSKLIGKNNFVQWGSY